MTVEFGPDLRFASNENDTNPIMARRLNGALDLGLGRPVRSHRVQSYDACHEEERGWLAGFLYVQNLASLIVTALGAGAMGHLLFVAVGAFRK
jgi:hypothetical protein